MIVENAAHPRGLSAFNAPAPELRTTRKIWMPGGDRTLASCGPVWLARPLNIAVTDPASPIFHVLWTQWRIGFLAVVVISVHDLLLTVEPFAELGEDT
jgi:hypothetical protein